MRSPSFLEQMKHYGVALAVLFVVFGVGVAVGKPFGPLTGQTANDSLCYYTKTDGTCGTVGRFGAPSCPQNSYPDPSQVPACNTKNQLPLPTPVSCTGTECANGGDSYCQNLGDVCESSPDVPCIICVKPSSSSAASVALCGNGVVDPGEQCDDGPNNGLPGDDCSGVCQIIHGAPSGGPMIIDDSDTTYFRGVPSLHANTSAPAAYNGEDFVAPAGTYTVADWDFAQVPAGSYDVYASWPSSDKNDTVVTYTALQPASDGTMTTLFTKSVDQTQVPTPDRMTAAGVTFQKIGSVSFTGLPPIIQVSGVPKSQYSLDAVAMAAPLSITSLSPSSGPVGTQVTITGTGFDPTNNTVQFAFEFNKFEHIPSPDGKHLIFTVPAQIQLPCQSDPTQTCSQSVLAGSYDVSVQIGSQTSNKLTFTVAAASSASGASSNGNQSITIDSLSPSSGPISTQVAITGAGFSNDDVVNFGGNIIKPSFGTAFATSMTFTVPASMITPCPPGYGCDPIPLQPGKYDVSVQEGSNVSNKLTFTVTGPGGGGGSASSISNAGGSSSAMACTNEYQMGDFADSVAIADFNGDGKLDLAAAGPVSDIVSVFLNKGDGTFQPKMENKTNNPPYSILAADFNGDGKPDLVVTDGGTDGTSPIAIFLNLGNGLFSKETDVQLPKFTGISSFTAGDINGDGIPDLIVPEENSKAVAVLLNNGDGAFAAPQVYPTELTPDSVAIGDLNGDGKPDLAVANDQSATISILLNTGNGTFAPQVEYHVGNYPSSIVIGDLNGDGKPDLAVTDTGMGETVDGRVSILFNLGNGRFGGQMDIVTGNQTDSVAISNLNGDGLSDLVVTHANITSVLLNHGKGVFSDSGDYPGLGTSNSVAIGDLNGDGKPDLAVANDGNTGYNGFISVFFNNGDGTFSSCAQGSSSAPACGPDGATCTSNGFPGMCSNGVCFTYPPVSSAASSLSGYSCKKDSDCPQPLTACKIGSPCPFEACVNGQCVLQSGVWIASLSPSSGPVGTQVTVTGTDFNKNANTVVLEQYQHNTNYPHLESVLQNIPSPDGTHLQFTVPAQGSTLCPGPFGGCPQGPYIPGPMSVIVEETAENSNTATFTVTASGASSASSRSSAGSLFVTADTQPRSHQLLGGAVGDNILQLIFRAQNEDIAVTKLHILVAGNGAQSVDSLLLYQQGQTQPFATATVAATGPDNVPATYNGQPAVAFTAIMTNGFVIPSGQQVTVDIVPRMKSDTNGGVSGKTLQAVIYKDSIVNDQTGEGAVHAYGVVSGNLLTGNSGKNPPDGEIFIGANTPASNSDIVGPMEQTVLSKITSIVNANPDPDGTAVPTGVYAVAQFAFTAATNTNALNGLNKAVLSGVIFDVQSTNVQFDDNSFRFMNLRTQSASAPCVVMDSHGTIITGTTVGPFLVACNGLTSSSVDTSIASGQSQSFGLEANIINSQVGTGNAGLLVSITNFSSITANGYGPNSSHLQWIDRDAASANLFNWIEYPTTVIRSTQYGAGSGGQKGLACKTDSDCPQPDCIANNNCPHEACINGQCTLQTMHKCVPIDCPAPQVGCHYANATADSLGCPLSCGTLVCTQPQLPLPSNYWWQNILQKLKL